MKWLTIVVLLLGGLAIFMHGMTVMTDALKDAAGSRMKGFLKNMTRNRWTSLLAGTGITAVIQSSSVTTVLAVGFVSAGLLTFQSTMGVILGANIGTTITAQIIAFKVTSAAWLMVATGYLFSVIFSKRRWKEIGTIVMGLGLVFLGMNVMSEATEPLKSYEPFVQLMEGLDNYFPGIIIGLVFTALVQSSSATTGVVIILASQQLLSVEGGIAIVLGANIGTCITAVLSALGKPRDAMRVAFSHVIFNVAGVLLWLAFIDQLADIVGAISEHDSARQIANAHTIFNVVNTIIFIWLVNPLARLVLWLIPKREKPEISIFPELHEFFLENPSMAIELAGESIHKLGKRTLAIVENGLKVALYGNSEQLGNLRKKDRKVDRGHAEILVFLQKIQGLKLTESEVKNLERLVEAANVLELTADLITTQLVEAAEHRIDQDFTQNPETVLKLTGMYQISVRAFESALLLLHGEDPVDPLSIDKEYFKESLMEVRSYLLARLATNEQDRIAKYRFESELLEVIRRLHALARRIMRKAG